MSARCCGKKRGYRHDNVRSSSPFLRVKQVACLATFADPGRIAIENVRLFG
jgi:hypothetical protein